MSKWSSHSQWSLNTNAETNFTARTNFHVYAERKIPEQILLCGTVILHRFQRNFARILKYFTRSKHKFFLADEMRYNLNCNWPKTWACETTKLQNKIKQFRNCPRIRNYEKSSETCALLEPMSPFLRAPTMLCVTSRTPTIWTNVGFVLVVVSNPDTTNNGDNMAFLRFLR